MNGTSQALNAVIAMLEDRPALFKELLRAPNSNVADLSELESRLRRAVRRYAATQVRIGLMTSLHVRPSLDKEVDALANSTNDVNAFYDGARAVEEVFEQLAHSLET